MFDETQRGVYLVFATFPTLLEYSRVCVFVGQFDSRSFQSMQGGGFGGENFGGGGGKTTSEVSVQVKTCDHSRMRMSTFTDRNQDLPMIASFLRQPGNSNLALVNCCQNFKDSKNSMSTQMDPHSVPKK